MSIAMATPGAEGREKVESKMTFVRLDQILLRQSSLVFQLDGPLAYLAKTTGQSTVSVGHDLSWGWRWGDGGGGGGGRRTWNRG